MPGRHITGLASIFVWVRFRRAEPKPDHVQVTAAWRRGRVDAVVQSTDKNFLVPVGGAVVAAGRRRPGLVAAVNKVRGRRVRSPEVPELAPASHHTVT